MENTGANFPDDYAEARRRFREAAAIASAELDCIALESPAPHGGSLAIDLAMLGDADAPRLVVHVSGTHGVEGFAGSAIQLLLLESGIKPPDGTALLFVHALNPYGMAWLRRVNENNVDLNRNCMPPDGTWSGAPTTYSRLAPFLNPPSAPRSDMFLIRAAFAVLRYGFGNLRQAVAGGQYEYPNGLFYGGRALEPGLDRYRKWLCDRLTAVESCIVIDVHTGLGPWGKESLFLRAAASGDLGLRDLPGRRIVPDASATGEGYATSGGHANLYLNLPSRPRVDFVTQEFGTYSALRVLDALRDENRWHHWGGGGLNHESKRRLKEMFWPNDAAWRARVLARGACLVRDVISRRDARARPARRG